jgi:glyoxylase-like metal-dependent hydrolase (beta-lactamase superfamily II)
MKITSNVFVVGGSSESHSSDALIYLIKSDREEAALVDAGTGRGKKKVMKNISEYISDPSVIKYIFLTHCHYDHSGGINEIVKWTGAEVVAHELDAQYMENGDTDVTAASWYGASFDPVHIEIKVNSDVKKFQVGDLEISYHHTPGHSPGSSILTVESDGQLVLFGQDVHGPLNRILLSNRKDYITSLEYMLSLNADILCEGHFGIFKGKKNVKEFIESYL